MCEDFSLRVCFQNWAEVYFTEMGPVTSQLLQGDDSVSCFDKSGHQTLLRALGNNEVVPMTNDILRRFPTTPWEGTDQNL